MKKYFSLKKLDESSLNRIMSHGKYGFIIISAHRSVISDKNPDTDLSEEYEEWLDEYNLENSEINQDKFLDAYNRHADKQLAADIKSAGYAFSSVFGGYHPDPKINPGVPDEYEPSYIVYNHIMGDNIHYDDWDVLKEFAIEMCKKYKQDSVYIQAPGESPVYINMHGVQVSSKSSLNFKFNDDKQEFYTTASRKKNSTQRFTADIQFENLYCEKRISSLNERMRRSKSGEILLYNYVIFIT